MHKYNNFIFERYPLTSKRVISSGILDKFPRASNNLDIEYHLEPYFDVMVLELRTYLMSKTHKTGRQVIETIYTPVSAWDHFKKDYLPDWFINRFPVKYREIKATLEDRIVKVCPHSDHKRGEDKLIHIVWLENPLAESIK